MSESKPSQSSTNRASRVFVSYSHADRDLRNELEKHLSFLKREGLISTWHDGEILPGSEWSPEIRARLEAADVILLLVSSDFMASDFCYGFELQRAMERHNSGSATVIPIILRPADWATSPFALLQALPLDATPVTLWSNRDLAFVNAVQGVRKAIGKLNGLRHQDDQRETEATTTAVPLRAPPGVGNRQRLIDVLSEVHLRRWGINSYHLHGDIPIDKRRNAYLNYGIPDDEEIILLVDTSFWGGAKSGCALGLRGLYWSDGWAKGAGDRRWISYCELQALSIRPGANTGILIIGEGIDIEMFGGVQNLDLVLSEIKKRKIC
jgi:hypothetical protein